MELGYNAFVADLFGKEFRGNPRDMMFGEMNRLKGDRDALRRRLQRSSSTCAGFARCMIAQIVVAGYCFGGKCALDVARSGAEIAAAVVVPWPVRPAELATGKIRRKVVAFHGWDDPMAPPENVVALGQELTEAGSDWQIHAYGNVAPRLHQSEGVQAPVDGVRYNALAAERSWTSFINLLEELFADAWLNPGAMRCRKRMQPTG